MTAKEVEDITIDLLNYLSIAEKQDSATAANAATDMVKSMLSRYPKLRYMTWVFNQQEVLDNFNLDYGTPFNNR